MSRPYVSRLRSEQAEDTRHRILAALAEQLAAAGTDFSLAEVAARAGVSLRTLHHHFPDADGRVAALADWIDRQVGLSPDEGPATAKDIAPYARRVTETFFAHESLLRAQMASGVATAVRRQRRKKREARIHDAVSAVSGASRESELVSAILSHLISADTAIALKDRFGLPSHDASSAIEWAAKVLAQAATRGELPETHPEATTEAAASMVNEAR